MAPPAQDNFREAQAKGYVPGAHKADDSRHKKVRYSRSALKNQESILRRYHRLVLTFTHRHTSLTPSRWVECLRKEALISTSHGIFTDVQTFPVLRTTLIACGLSRDTETDNNIADRP